MEGLVELARRDEDGQVRAAREAGALPLVEDEQLQLVVVLVLQFVRLLLKLQLVLVVLLLQFVLLLLKLQFVLLLLMLQLLMLALPAAPPAAIPVRASATAPATA